MPYVRPTLAQINGWIQADIKAQMGTQASFLRRSWIGVFGRVLAAACHLLYGYISHAIKQLFVASADEDSIVKQASLYGIYRIPASFAFGTVTFTGVANTQIPLNTVLLRADGERFVTTIPADIGFGLGIEAPTPIPVRSAEPGKNGNTDVGAVFTLESPRVGLNETHTVTAAITNGADLEPIEDFVERYQSRLRNVPQGGSKADYFQWAKEVPNVGLVMVFAPGEISIKRGTTAVDFLPPVGEVWIYFGVKNSNVQPTLAKILEMQNYINGKKPVTATVKVFGIKNRIIPFNIAVTLAPGYALSQARTDIQNALTDLLEEQAIPTSTLFLSQIKEAISSSPAEVDHVLVTPSGNLVMGVDEVGVLDTANPVNFVITVQS